MSEFDYMEVFVDGVPQRRRCTLVFRDPGPRTLRSAIVNPRWVPELLDGEQLVEELGGRVHIIASSKPPETREVLVEPGSEFDLMLQKAWSDQRALRGEEFGVIRSSRTYLVRSGEPTTGRLLKYTLDVLEGSRNEHP